jgi:hypothetical protein
MLVIGVAAPGPTVRVVDGGVADGDLVCREILVG